MRVSQQDLSEEQVGHLFGLLLLQVGQGQVQEKLFIEWVIAFTKDLNQTLHGYLFDSLADFVLILEDHPELEQIYVFRLIYFAFKGLA